MRKIIELPGDIWGTEFDNIISINYGGSAWESNPPGTVLAPHTEFEVREAHQ